MEGPFCKEDGTVDESTRNNSKNHYEILKMKAGTLYMVHYTPAADCAGEEGAEDWGKATPGKGMLQGNLVCENEKCKSVIETSSLNSVTSFCSACGTKLPTNLVGMIKLGIVPEKPKEQPKFVDPETENSINNIKKNSQMQVQRKDPELRRYEKALDMAIESTRENKTRFPMTLFGMVITFGVLMGWIAIASGPVLEQIRTLVPQVARKGCDWIVHSDFLEQATHAMDAQAANAVKSLESVDGEGENYNTLSSFNLPLLFKTSVCKPLLQNVEKAVSKKTSLEALNLNLDVGDNGTISSTHRRLSEPPSVLPPLAPVVGAFLENYDADRESKLAAVMLVLLDLERKAHRLLVRAPVAVRDMHAEHGLDAAWDVARFHYELDDHIVKKNSTSDGIPTRTEL